MILAKIIVLISLAVVGYHFIGYPILLWGWSRLRHRPVLKDSYKPTVSILIAAFNEQRVIEDKLNSCLRLEYPVDCLEIIVVSDGSTDATNEIIEGYAARQTSYNIRLITLAEREGKSNALNKAAQIATGEILIISDANAMLAPSSVINLVVNFADPTVGCASGSRQLMTDDGSIQTSAGLYWRYESAIKRWESQTGSTMGVLGSLLAVRTELFAPIPPDIINDDFYVALCSLIGGKRVIYEPDAICWAYASQSVEQDKIRRRRISAGRFQHLLRSFGQTAISNQDWVKLISHKYLRLFLLPFMLCALLASTALLLDPSITLAWIILWAGQLFFYALALLGWYLAGQGIRNPLPAIAYYILSGALASIEGIVGYVSGRQTVLWNKATRSSI